MQHQIAVVIASLTALQAATAAVTLDSWTGEVNAQAFPGGTPDTVTGALTLNPIDNRAGSIGGMSQASINHTGVVLTSPSAFRYNAVGSAQATGDPLDTASAGADASSMLTFTLTQTTPFRLEVVLTGDAQGSVRGTIGTVNINQSLGNNPFVIVGVADPGTYTLETDLFISAAAGAGAGSSGFVTDTGGGSLSYTLTVPGSGTGAVALVGIGGLAAFRRRRLAQ